MDFSHVAAISASGMEVERTRLDVAAINLANAHTTRTPEGGAFRPLRVISGVSGGVPFSSALGAGSASLFQTPQVLDVQRTAVAPRVAYEPGHPDADNKGFVAYPGVDSTAEMVNVMTAVRAYEANVVALNAAKAMTMKALEIGGGS